MSNKHTKGPWRVTSANGLPDAIVALSDELGSTPIAKIVLGVEHAANARLIALSPEMLNLLEKVEGYLAFEKSKQGRALYIEARTLGAKARGETA